VIGHDQLYAIAFAARSFLEPVWKDWNSKSTETLSVASSNTCGRSSLFLRNVLFDDFELPALWKNGTPQESCNTCGFLTDKGWKAHAWVNMDAWIIDITADQFGGFPVIITSHIDNRYREGNEDTALPEHRVKRIAAVNQIWPLWLKSPIRKALKHGNKRTR
jgi:hypothetical protein